MEEKIVGGLFKCKTGFPKARKMITAMRAFGKIFGC
jgi:hypothetical protein